MTAGGVVHLKRGSLDDVLADDMAFAEPESDWRGCEGRSSNEGSVESHQVDDPAGTGGAVSAVAGLLTSVVTTVIMAKMDTSAMMSLRLLRVVLLCSWKVHLSRV